MVLVPPRASLESRRSLRVRVRSSRSKPSPAARSLARLDAVRDLQGDRGDGEPRGSGVSSPFLDVASWGPQELLRNSFGNLSLAGDLRDVFHTVPTSLPSIVRLRVERECKIPVSRRRASSNQSASTALRPRACVVRSRGTESRRGAANIETAAAPSDPAVGNEVSTVWNHLTAGSETQISEGKCAAFPGGHDEGPGEEGDEGPPSGLPVALSPCSNLLVQ